MMCACPSRARLCIVVILVGVINLCALFAFVPQNWTLKTISKRDREFFTTDAKNTTEVHTTTPTQSAHISQEHRATEVAFKECPLSSRCLVGSLPINVAWAERNFWTESHLEPPTVNPNETSKILGHGKTVLDIQSVDFQTSPEDCRPQQSIAFIIPFRNREHHLRIFLGHLLPILQRQQIRYSIFVVEQVGQETFNKGRLMNAGFQFANESRKRSGNQFDCYIFHDVDMLSEYDTLLYRCSDGNKIDHLSTTIDKFDYRTMCCGMTVGGVLAVKEEYFHKVNGYPISYWGWGGEDDDMHRRIRSKGIEIVRPKPPLGRFTMIKHELDDKNPKNIHRLEILGAAVKRMESEGLSNLDTQIIKIEKYPLFIKLLVDVGKPPS